jgi:hypothetical protein
MGGASDATADSPALARGPDRDPLAPERSGGSAEVELVGFRLVLISAAI